MSHRNRPASDLSAVLGAIARTAAELCEANDGLVFLVDGDHHRLVARYGTVVHPEPLGATRPIRRDTPLGRALIDRRAVHIKNLGVSVRGPFRGVEDLSRQVPVRTVLAVPMLREGVALGGMVIRRTRVRPFTPKQVALLKTFADSAAIAIENARLSEELTARNRALTTALEQQTATAEVLRVISRSSFDVQPVFQAIVDSATRLLRGHSAVLSRIADDRIELAAYTQTDAVADALLESFFPVPLHSSGSDDRPIRDRVVGQRIPYNVADVEMDPRVGDRGRASARARGYRSQLVVPMLRNGEPIGTLAVTRREPGAFTDEETALLQTFADQGVIAIENARLFRELQERNRALTEALEQQTATSEILQVISSSPTETQPVFEAIAANAARLCSANDAQVLRVEGDQLRLIAAFGEASMPSTRRLTREHLVGRAVIDRTTIHVRDFKQALAEYPETTAAQYGVQSAVAVPLVRDDVALGVIRVSRREIRPFADKQISLLKTFADQAVIAIENVRLFNELTARTEQLTRSVQQLTALGEVGRAVSSTLDLEAVLTTIASRASQLAGTDTCTVYEYDESREEFDLRATHNVDERVLELTRVRPLRTHEGIGGRVAETRAPVQVENVANEAVYFGPLRDALLAAGVRSVLAIPLLREERLSGLLIVSRKTPGRFADEVVALLQTFGTQSAIAIHNARLYRELEAKGRELEAASRHKSQFLANMSHELRTPMNAILGYTELIADGIYGGVPEPMREVLARVDASGRHLLGLINDVLDLSKIEAGQLPLTLADYSMKEVVEAVVASVEALAAEKSLRLVVDLAPDLPVGRGDQRRLAQVLLNLVGNAIKFTEQGQIAIRVGAAAGLFTVAVSDTGPGIAPADQERIFEEFQQADTSSTRPKGGTGLGLAIARRIVAMHGGRIWVESALGEGATFRVTMPVRMEEARVGPA